MISNEHPSFFHRQPQRQPYQNQGHYQAHGYQQQPRPQVQEDTLKTIDFAVERKSFRLTLKENFRGRFLRITESCGTKFNSIVIPATGLADFQRLLGEMLADTADTAEVRAGEPQPAPAPEVPVTVPEAQIQAAPTPEPVPVAALPESEPKMKSKPAKAKPVKTKPAKLKPATKVKAAPKKASKVVKVRVAKTARAD